LIIALLALSGCGKSGNKFPNEEPTIRITSYEGFDDSELLAPFASDSLLFQQRIFWHATDPDGIITGFAYRVKDQNGNPIATPGNDFVDMDGDVTPQAVIDRFGTGWVLHYKTNADQSLPLDNPNASRTIWSSAKYATINFPAADANGNPLTIESSFEVIAIDNRGGITPVDPNYTKTSIAWRKFNATSERPTCSVTTTKGNPAGGEVGSGLRLDFTMHDTDPFIGAIPYKFEFKLMKVDPVDSTTVVPGSESEWFDTATSPNDDLMDQYLLTRYTSPALTYDVVDNVTNTLTKVQSRATDLAGVISEVNGDSDLLFAVKAGFRPKTIVYPERIYALGDYHYIDYTDESTPEILPFTIVGGLQRFATPFFIDMTGTKTAINSSNAKVWLRWGWHGEYGVVQASGSTIYTDNPYDKKVDTVLDRDTDMNYFSEITHFDLRLDGAPYNYPPLAGNPAAHIIDSDNKEWLRIPLYSPLGQTLVLTSLTNGEHSLEVRCVDLQGEVDPTPATYSFTLVEAVPVANRNGVLIIDDDLNNGSTSPDATVLANYQEMLANYNGPKTYIKRTRQTETGDTFEDFRKRHLAASDLQNYKMIIYHSDNPSDSGYLKNENDGLTMYLKTGGNLILSSTSKLSSTLDSFVLGAQRTFINYLGVPYVSPPAKILSDALQTRPFFQKAVGETGFPDIDLQWAANGQPGASFNPLVNNFQGLSTVTYFDSPQVTNLTIYRMGIKPVGYPVQGPTQEQFNTYNLKPIAIRNVTGSSHCYTFAFPLSYMQAAEAKAMMDVILAEVM
jgi:hypothetical protein